MSYGQTHTETLPTVGSTPQETFATMINAVLTEMRATLDAKVTPAGIDINADLSLRSGASYYGITNAHSVGFHAATALAAADYPSALYVNSDGNLYFNDSSGHQIPMTASGAVAGSAGSISSLASPAAVVWDSGAGDYNFYSDSGAGTYADLNAAALQLSDGSSNLLRIVAPSMSADYTLTLPAAVPATNNTVLAMATTGAVTATATPTVTTLTTTGLITAGAGLTASADQHVTVSGSGKFKHGSRRLTINPLGFGFGTSYTNNGGQVEFTSAAGEIYVSLALEVGWTIEAVSVYWEPAGTGSKTMAIYKRTENGTQSSIGSRTTTSSSESDYAITLTPDAAPVVLDDTSYYVLIGAGDSGDLVRTITVQYSQA